MNSERVIVENLSKRLRESCPMYTNCVDNSTDVERELVNLTAVYEFMINRGFNKLPDSTTEKRCLFSIYDRLKELGLNIEEPEAVPTPDFPGEFEDL